MKLCLATFAVLLTALSVQADVRLPALFSDHMVLQAGVEIPVWGWAEQGEAVSVTLGDQSATATDQHPAPWCVLRLSFFRNKMALV